MSSAERLLYGGEGLIFVFSFVGLYILQTRSRSYSGILATSELWYLYMIQFGQYSDTKVEQSTLFIHGKWTIHIFVNFRQMHLIFEME